MSYGNLGLKFKKNLIHFFIIFYKCVYFGGKIILSKFTFKSYTKMSKITVEKAKNAGENNIVNLRSVQL